MSYYSSNYCEDIMNEILREGDLKTSDRGYALDLHGTGVLEVWDITEDEERLLIKYSWKLFNTLPINVSPVDFNIESTMKKFVGICAYYFMSTKEKAKHVKKVEELSHKKKGEEEIIKSLLNHIQAIKNIIGNNSSYVHVKRLEETLNKCIKSPKSYLPKKIHEEILEQTGKNHIHTFLTNLHLPSKTNTIKAFLLELD